MDELKQLLAKLHAGEITLEDYKREAAKILASELIVGNVTQEQHDAELAKVRAEKGEQGDGGGNQGGQGGLTDEEVKRREQAAADRVRTEYAKKQKELQDRLDKLQREKMTDEERAAAERDEYTKKLEERERELQAREVKLHAVDALRAKELPHEFLDFVTADTVEDTDAKITALSSVYLKAVEEAVKKRFKDGGGDPNKGKGGQNSGVANPWKAETRNLTEQGRITRDNPELARQLKAAAGIN